MRLSILSDIHDRVSHLKQVLGRMKPLRPDAILLCGDITKSESLLAARLPGLPLAYCLGNCDRGEAAHLKAIAAEHGIGAWGELGEWSLGPDLRPVAFTHFPALAAKAAATGRYQAVFYGHTHRRAYETVEGPEGTCLLANPGDVEGRHARPGGLIWDSESGILEWV